MSELKEFLLPDIGSDAADVTEILVSVGDMIKEDQDIISLEGDKASMDVPAAFAGKVVEIKMNVGDSVSEGQVVIIVDVAGSASTDAPVVAPRVVAPVEALSASASVEVVEVCLPDIGGDEVEVTEVLVAVGDIIEADQDILSVEGDKASMDVPAPFAGVVKEIKISAGDKVSEGTLLLMLEVQASGAPVAPVATVASAPVVAEVAAPKAAPAPVVAPTPALAPADIKASPSVRRIAREFDIELGAITATGRKGRISKEDVQKYVKRQLQIAKSGGGTGNGLQVLAYANIDYSKFGDVEIKPLSRIQKISGPTLHRNWVTIPHVTQFDEADITELEAFRKEQNAIAAKKDLGLKISPLVFMMKAVAKALQQYPNFNSALSSDGESIVLKKYFNIGIAVDTPNGLVVPVVKDVLNKGIYDISRELGEISKKARAGKLTAKDMQGGSMTISSLGGIGGTQFTPIVNAPEVAILGVSKSAMKPVWNGTEFKPRLMVPLALSYDHRVIDGADGARFITAINNYLADLRTLIL
ncbi:2-oxoglutarate dehydrogenase complex, dihydrolipoamide acetyltransferase E2 component [Psychromonas sp. CNPT3]|uniref:dihydrolipoyllysine-residue acetyltransferase n=1 Tax=Psychromonas sp. CNPT3 TaxID=314282 RepID=UPI00006E348D|nr:dihydrolipoyllysine-residue acetyltransferase [Psychromonas sp. CNPT3]AGH80584.1 2-oxoglutarate dehydrogenase complex, dihydrolipoamide acetyltransferase E2 component [Psychromonas sp. CNPT3]